MTNRTIPLFCAEDLSLIPCNELTADGWDLEIVTTVSEATALIRRNKFIAGLLLFSDTTKLPLESVEEILLTDVGVEWLALIDPVHLHSPDMTRFLLGNFFDFQTYPIDPVRLLVTLGNAYSTGLLKYQIEGRPSFRGSLIGESSIMQELYRKMIKMQADDAPVLITGESGTGKELVAQAIHQGSPRRHFPFVAVNCGAIPANLVQSELFGHEKGAFTDAFQRKIGRFETAAGGTILLDEIGDLPLPSQVHLLRFLQEKSIERVGSSKVLPIDVRVLAATNVDLEEAVSRGCFRADLFYRLNVLRLRVPSLHDRAGDVELLAQFFLEEFSLKLGKKKKWLSTQAVRAMYDHCWPGNVRELINRVRRAVVMSEGRLIMAADLGLESPDPAEPLSLDRAREIAELVAIKGSLHRNKHNVSEAARQLGVSRVTLYRLINKFHEQIYPRQKQQPPHDGMSAGKTGPYPDANPVHDR